MMEFKDGYFKSECHRCGTQTSTHQDEFSTNYIEDFGQWENLMIDCPICRMNGEPYIQVININIPYLCEMEPDVMEDDTGQVSNEEKRDRIAVRELMWAVRPDLLELDKQEVIDSFSG